MLELLPVVLFGISAGKNRESAGSRRVFSSSSGDSIAIFENLSSLRSSV